jgi:hypothetical protein
MKHLHKKVENLIVSMGARIYKSNPLRLYQVIEDEIKRTNRTMAGIGQYKI